MLLRRSPPNHPCCATGLAHAAVLLTRERRPTACQRVRALRQPCVCAFRLWRVRACARVCHEEIKRFRKCRLIRMINRNTCSTHLRTHARTQASKGALQFSSARSVARNCAARFCLLTRMLRSPARWRSSRRTARLTALPSAICISRLACSAAERSPSCALAPLWSGFAVRTARLLQRSAKRGRACVSAGVLQTQAQSEDCR